MDVIEPHGGELKDLYLQPAEAALHREKSAEYPSWDLTRRQLCDLELLMCGAFSPLEGFLGREDYESVLDAMRLSDGTLWPMPITLDVTRDFASQLGAGERISLIDPEGVPLAVVDVEDIWEADWEREARQVFGTPDLAHPGVNYLQRYRHPIYIGGRVLGLTTPTHYDFRHLRDTPSELRGKFQKWGWNRVVAFQTRNPMHRAHQELAFQAAQSAEANLLVHPVVGMTKPGDVDHFTRVRCYEHIVKRLPDQSTALSLLPLAMRMGGPREAVWHAIIRKNYGCTHLIIGRDHAGPGKNSEGSDFYGPYEAQELVREHADELGIEMVPFRAMVYVQNRAEYRPVDEIEDGETVLNISGTELRRRLQEGRDIPEWFTYPEIAAELRRTHPPRHRQGFAVFLTGLSGAGKSTIANALCIKLLELGGRSVTLLDGDIVRKHLSSELGFSKEHRDLNIQRIGFVASEIAKNGGVAICAPIAPYEAGRRAVREMVSEHSGFVEVHVATSLELCEQRDRKGLYAKARAGLITGFTGIDDPYEEPENPEVRIDTAECTPDEAAHRIILKLESLGYIR
jgi:sulfate adenylyltransferase